MGVTNLQIRIYNREKIYNEVWTESVVKVAKRYGVSNVHIKRICKRMNIPVPENKYWTNVYNGVEMPKTPLPEYNGPDKLELESYGSKPVSIRTKMLKKLSYLPKEERETIVDYCHNLLVPNEIINPHKLVAEMTLTYVSDDMKERAIIFIDTLFKALEHLGYSIEMRMQQLEGTPIFELVPHIGSGDITIPISIREIQKKVLHKPTEEELRNKELYDWNIPYFDTVYSGELMLEYIIENAEIKTWKDDEKKLLEEYIGEIIVDIINVIDKYRLKRTKQIKQDK